MLSETVQLELVKAIPQDLMALGVMVGAFFSYLAHRQAKKTEENTNHLKDELVAEVKKVSFAAGQEAQRGISESREKDYQAGRKDQAEGNPTT